MVITTEDQMLKNTKLNKLCIYLCLVAALLSSCSRISDFQSVTKPASNDSKSQQIEAEIPLESEQCEREDEALLSYAELIEIAISELKSVRAALPEDVAEQVEREAEDEIKALEELYFAGYDEDGRAVYGRELSLAKAALLTEKYRAAASGEPPRAYTR